MNLSRPHPELPAQRAERAFTMVEIALALAVIGFALVAIIGVLPTGMGVQKENREETIINQDAAYWMEAIRNGARGLDDLTNYVDAITNVVTVYIHPDWNSAWIVVGQPTTYGYTYTNGARIIGLLSTPTYIPAPVNPGGLVTNNHVTAHVRALSGAVTEKAPQNNPGIKELAFSYRLTPEIIPYSNWDTSWINYGAPGLPPAEVIARSNYWRLVMTLNANLYDLRLTFRWPLVSGGNAGMARQSFRTMISGHQTNQPSGSPWHFFESRSYMPVRTL